MNYIIGCGGGGSWLAPALCLLVKPDNVTLIDGDNLEEKNLNRQLFSRDAIGKNKAEALAGIYGARAVADWYNAGTIKHGPDDWLFGCVDNNQARAGILCACDRYGCSAILAANETNSAEAYLYRPQWRETRLDPRTYYPGILTNNEGDPQRVAIGCTGESQLKTPQLVTANFMSAALAGHLYVTWAIELPKIETPETVIAHLPYKLAANMTKLETFKVETL